MSLSVGAACKTSVPAGDTVTTKDAGSVIPVVGFIITAVRHPQHSPPCL